MAIQVDETEEFPRENVTKMQNLVSLESRFQKNLAARDVIL